MNDIQSRKGVNELANSIWYDNARVIGLWSIDQERNAWAYFDTLGWHKISTETDAIFYQFLTYLIAAKAAARPVSFYEENGVIKQLYVF